MMAKVFIFRRSRAASELCMPMPSKSKVKMEMSDKKNSKLSKKKLAELWPDSNEFEAVTSVSLPAHLQSKLHVWLNLQHRNERIMDLSVKCSKEHQDAAYNLHRSRKYTLKFRINKKGDWILLGVK